MESSDHSERLAQIALAYKEVTDAEEAVRNADRDYLHASRLFCFGFIPDIVSLIRQIFSDEIGQLLLRQKDTYARRCTAHDQLLYLLGPYFPDGAGECYSFFHPSAPTYISPIFARRTTVH